MKQNRQYDQLVKHMQKWLMGLPDTREMRELLENRMGPEEAEFLARFPFLPQTIEQLSEEFGVSREQLKAKLDPLARKGLVFRHESRSTIRYALNGSMFMLYRSPFWSGNDDENTRRLAHLTNKYFYPVYGHEFGEAAVVDQELCIGCGVCAHKCPTQSIQLARRPEGILPCHRARDGRTNGCGARHQSV